jgi:hypothetical protein
MQAASSNKNIKSMSNVNKKRKRKEKKVMFMSHSSIWKEWKKLGSITNASLTLLFRFSDS